MEPQPPRTHSPQGSLQGMPGVWCQAEGALGGCRGHTEPTAARILGGWARPGPPRRRVGSDGPARSWCCPELLRGPSPCPWGHGVHATPPRAPQAPSYLSGRQGSGRSAGWRRSVEGRPEPQLQPAAGSRSLGGKWGVIGVQMCPPRPTPPAWVTAGFRPHRTTLPLWPGTPTRQHGQEPLPPSHCLPPAQPQPSQARNPPLQPQPPPG